MDGNVLCSWKTRIETLVSSHVKKTLQLESFLQLKEIVQWTNFGVLFCCKSSWTPLENRTQVRWKGVSGCEQNHFSHDCCPSTLYFWATYIQNLSCIPLTLHKAPKRLLKISKCGQLESTTNCRYLETLFKSKSESGEKALQLGLVSCKTWGYSTTDRA